MALNRVTQIDHLVAIKNVLVSVSDKSGLQPLVEALVAVNPDIRFYSTGGTYAALQVWLGERAEKHLRAVSDYTGQPEMQGGLVKTLDFKIYMGILSETYNPDHRQDLKRTASVEFDMVIVNLYPFQQTVAQAGISLEDGRTNIDIGGPCMLRASAKNFLRVASVCDPADYPRIQEQLQTHQGQLSVEFRLELARKTFAHTAAYDAAIAEFLRTATPDLHQLYQPGGRV